ncbi:hypothetical protein KIN20_009448 [Parelaphostrongylus tenuis]|uniref:Uncharacterized protein n=1 Tax=Parelaphostrongylus tenuis TaxID=148309 RepID=A0AAD5MXS8_PARTN|nr:hypothetical protein KIN20_009448 [Parelaphostrongylus tenuis]
MCGEGSFPQQRNSSVRRFRSEAQLGVGPRRMRLMSMVSYKSVEQLRFVAKDCTENVRSAHLPETPTSQYESQIDEIATHLQLFFHLFDDALSCELITRFLQYTASGRNSCVDFSKRDSKGTAH